jgi:predicted dehydrogenase
VGLLGVGDAGRHHARALAIAHRIGALQWTAVGVRDVVKGEAVRGDLGLPADTAIVPGDQVLDGGLCDAVILATPDGLHHVHAARALAARLHVLVEKPLALTSLHAEDLVSQARANDRVLTVGYHLRHHVGHQHIHGRLKELVGRIRSLLVRWAWPDPATGGWRAHGEHARWWSLAALGTHAIDLALWLVEEPLAEVAAVREPATGIDRAAEVSLRFTGGALAHVSCAVTHRARPTIAIAGDAGELELVGTLGARGAGTILHIGRGEIPFTAEDPYARQLRAFVARCDGTGPRIDLHAVDNVAVLERIQGP